MKNIVRLCLLQYGIGLVIHVAYLAILLGTNYDNMQLPVGDFSCNAWRGMDVLSYVVPAEHFVESGVFATGNGCDYHRTIGYPLFLAAMMKLFGGEWVLCTYLVQAVLLALIYPVLSVMTVLLFPGRERLPWSVFVFSVIGTAYWSYASQILTDGMFTMFFLTGVCCGMLSVVWGSWLLCLVEVLLVGYAAQVRPVLILFPFLNIFLLLLTGRQNQVPVGRRVIGIIAVSSMVSVIVCNGPSIRNYMNHGVFQPTDVLANSLGQYLGRQVLCANGQREQYSDLKDELKKLKEKHDLKGIIALQNRVGMEAVRNYPAASMKVLAYNTFWNLFEFHWQTVFHLWGKNWLSTDGAKVVRFVRSNDATVIGWAWVVVYLAVYSLFLWFLLGLVRARDWLFLVTIVLFLAPLLPASIAGQGSRMRLFAEGFVIMMAFSKAVILRSGKSESVICS